MTTHCKGESGWSFSCDLVPRASDYLENGHVIQFVPTMLEEQLAEAIWESSFLGLVGEVPSEFYSQSFELWQPSSFQHAVEAARLQGVSGTGVLSQGIRLRWSPSELGTSSYMSLVLPYISSCFSCTFLWLTDKSFPLLSHCCRTVGSIFPLLFIPSWLGPMCSSLF